MEEKDTWPLISQWRIMNGELKKILLVLFMQVFIGIVFNWNHFEMRLLNLRINFYLSITVTRLSIPIQGRGKSPEEGQRWNLAET